jgi:hypothetical protein
VAQGTEAELVSRTGGLNKLLITVRGEAEAFRTWLQGSELVTRATPREAADGQACFLVEMKGDQREELLAQLVAKGFGLRLVEAPEDELEEIFLGLTRKEAA